MKHHEFILTVKSEGTRSQAEMAVLTAFAKRNPDDCSFHLSYAAGATITPPSPHSTNQPMTPHPHAQNMLAYSQDAAETDKPWLRWECIRPNFHPYTYLPCLTHPNWDESTQYRRKRRMIVVNGVKVPAPEIEKPKLGQEYWVVEPSITNLRGKDSWADAPSDNRYLERGLVYINEDDAIERAKAMLITTPCES